jgi:MFS transporter, DHA2 family, multidrug resistance protein
MSAALTQSPAAESHRLVAFATLMVCFIQSATISLPNAALLHIQGSLSMADDEVGWIFSSYIAASLITLPVTHWLAGRFGRKTVYQASMAIFAFGLLLAVRAETPMQLIAARIVQGLASGPLAPLSVGILVDVLPPRQHASIGLVATVTLMLGILSGPSIGGWLGEYHGWRSMFLISLAALGCIFPAVALCLPEKRAAQNPSFDFFGMATFSFGVIGLQMMLDRGERMEWFNSAEIWTETIASALGFYLYLVHILTTKVHFLDKALFRNRNFVLSTILYFVVGFMLLPTMALTSPMLDELLKYPADTTGYMTIPRGVALLGTLILTARITARIDFRLLLCGGMAFVTYGNWRMVGYSPAMDWSPVVIAGVIQGAGLGILLPALANAAFSTLHTTLRPEGTVFFNLSRLYGSTIGIALVQLFFYDNLQAMHVGLAKNLTPYHAVHVMGSVAGSRLAALNEIVTGQAAFVGIIDQFKLMMIVMIIVCPLVLFLERPGSANA